MAHRAARAAGVVALAALIIVASGAALGGNNLGGARINGGVVTQPVLLAVPVWDDLRISANDMGLPGAADPAQTTYQPTGSGTTFDVYGYDKNDYTMAHVQIPHGFKAGTDLKIHIHWTPRDQGNEESGNTVGWKVDYSAAPVAGTFPASGTADLSDACTGTDHYHEMTPMGTVSGTGLSESSILLLKIYRSDTGADDTWTGAAAATFPVLLSVDLHFQVEKLGTTGSY